MHALKLSGYARDERAPEFVTLSADGRRVSLTDLRGRVVILTFWASWCEPCRDELPLFEALHRDHADGGLVVVGVNSRERPAIITEYARAHRLTFPLARDEAGTVSQMYGVVGLPTTFVIGRDGRAIARAIGPRDWASDPARALVRSLLSEPRSRP